VGLAGQVTIIADQDTNALLVRTNPKNYDRVKMILDDLDRPVAQVLIKVLIAEVTHDSATDLGTELSAMNLWSTTSVNSAGQVVGRNQGQVAGSNFNLANQPNGLQIGISEHHFDATIKLLQSTGKVDVLSRPYIL